MVPGICVGVQSSFDVQDMGVRQNTYRHFLCSARERVWVVNRAKAMLLSCCVGTEQPGTQVGGGGDIADGSQDTGLMLSVVRSTFPWGVKGHGCTRVTPQLHPLLCSLLQFLYCHLTGPKSAAPAEMKEAVKWDGMYFPHSHGNLESSGCKDLPGMLLAAQQSLSAISRCQFPDVAGQAVAAGALPAPHCLARAGKF